MSTTDNPNIKSAITIIRNNLTPECLEKWQILATSREEFAKRLLGVVVDGYRPRVEQLIDDVLVQTHLEGCEMRKNIIHSLLHLYHPDKRENGTTDDFNELYNRLTQALAELGRDEEFLNGPRKSLREWQVNDSHRPEEDTFARVGATLLQGNAVATWKDLKPFLKYDGSVENRDLSSFIETVDSFDCELMSLKDRENVLQSLIKVFMKLLNIEFDSLNVRLITNNKYTTLPMINEAVYIPDDNEIRVYEPSNPLTAVLTFLFKNSNIAGLQDPDLKAVFKYVQAYSYNQLGFPEKLVQTVIASMKRTPAVALLNDEDLNKLTHKERYFRMKEMAGDRYNRHKIPPLTNIDLVHAGRLLDTCPLDEVFTQLCQEAGEKFARTNPLEKLRNWSTLDHKEQRIALETVLEDLDKSFANSAPNDIAVLFEEKNQPQIVYAEMGENKRNFKKGEVTHNGRNQAVQHYPLINHTAVGTSFMASEWSVNKGRRDTYRAADLVDWQKPDTFNPYGEILRFPSKECHPDLNEARKSGFNGQYISWNDCHNGWKHGQADRPDNKFWQYKYSTDVLKEIVRIYFKSLYEDRIPRVIKAEEITEDHSLYEFAVRRNLIWKGRMALDTPGFQADLSQAVNLHNTAFTALQKRKARRDCYSASSNNVESPEIQGVLKSSPFNRWENILGKELDFDNNRLLEVYKNWATKWLKNPRIFNSMIHVQRFFLQVRDRDNKDLKNLKIIYTGLKLRSAILNRLNAFATPPEGMGHYEYRDSNFVGYYISSLNKADLMPTDLEELEAAHWIHHCGRKKKEATIEDIHELKRMIVSGEKTAREIKANFQNEIHKYRESKNRLEDSFKDAIAQIPSEFSIVRSGGALESDELQHNVMEREAGCLKDYLLDCRWYLYGNNGTKHVAGIQMLPKLVKVMTALNLGVETWRNTTTEIKDRMNQESLDEIVKDMIQSRRG